MTSIADPAGRAVHVLYLGDDTGDEAAVALSRDPGFLVEHVPGVGAAIALTRVVPVDCVVVPAAGDHRAGVDAVRAMRRADPDVPIVLVGKGGDRPSSADADVVVALDDASYPSVASAVTVAIVRRHSRSRVRRDAWFAHQVIAALACGVVVHDTGHRLLAVNGAAMDLMGGLIDDPTGAARRAGWRLVALDGTPVDELPSAQCVRIAADVPARLVGVVSPEGHVTWVFASARLLRRDGEARGVVTTIVDASREVALGRAHAHAAAVLDVVRDAVVELDDDDAVRGCNAAARAVLGWPAGPPAGARLEHTAHGDSPGPASFVATHGGHRLTGVVVGASTGAARRTVVLRPSGAAGETCERLVSRLARSAPDLVLVTGADGVITAVNDAGSALLGRSREDLLGCSIADVLPAVVLPDPRGFVSRRPVEVGRLRVEVYPAHDAGGAANGSIVVGEAAGRAAAAATVAPAHASPADRFEQATTRGVAGVVALRMGDLDPHAAAAAAARVRRALPHCAVGPGSPGVVAIVWADASLGAAVDVALRALAAVEHVTRSAGSDGTAAVTGIRLANGGSFDAALRAAAQAARDTGGARRVGLADDHTGPVARRLDRLVGLRDAVAKNRLDVHFEPIVELAGGQVIGLEAVPQWRSGDPAGCDGPTTRSLAEELGIERLLDAQLLKKAAELFAGLTHEGAVSLECFVSADVSRRTVTAPGFAQFLATTAADQGLQPGRLVVEVSERRIAATRDSPALSPLALRKAGIAVAVDDFGTGGFPLSAARRLSGVTLKIAAPLVNRMPGSPADLVVVRTVTELARVFGSRTVALGVDTVAIADSARQAGCDAAQGALWSAPVPASEVGALVSALRRGLPRAADRRRQRSRGDEVGGLGDEHGLGRLLALDRGGSSPESIAAALNAEGYRTPTGTRWHPATVRRVVDPARRAQTAWR